VIFLISSTGTQLLSTTLGVKSYLRREFLKVEEEILVPHKQLFPSPVTLDDFSWAFGILRSRSFSRLRGQNLVLIPLADLVSSFFFFFESVFSS
jgi:[ribulose-bisphosphate carboxylase]-lysine N-methyltransferase